MTAAVGQQRRGAAGWLQPLRHRQQTLSTWALTLALVLYFAFDNAVDNSGYAITAFGPASVVVWWIVAVCAAWGLLPLARRPDRTARTGLLLFGGFTAWTALGITWSISSGRSFEDLAMVTGYLGILVLAVQIHRERGEALRQTVTAVATAIVIIALVAVASRLWPNLFSGSQVTEAEAKELGGSAARLAWPLGYWNGLGALMAIGVPLLLGLATSTRPRWIRGAAAAAVPLVALCGALTQSRGALVEAFVGLVVFIALAPQRATKLITYAITAVGGALLIDYSLHQGAIKNNLGVAQSHQARIVALAADHSHQAWMVALATVVICAGVGVAQAGADRLITHRILPRLLSPSLRQARIALAAAAVLVVLLALAAHGPAHISHVWNSFKSATGANTTNHYASSGGEGRYQFWVAGIDSAKAHPFTGSGPGTFQLDYLPRATVPVYTVNAHSLYVETYTELGLVGVLLLVAFLVTALVVLIRQVVRSRAADRVTAAAAAAALTTFLIGAAIDWLWQLQAVVAVALLIIGAGLAPREESVSASSAAAVSTVEAGPPTAVAPTTGSMLRLRPLARAVAVFVSLACVFAAAYPLIVSDDIASSSNITNIPGNLTAAQAATAISDARDAASLESGSAAAQVQLALSLGDAGRYSAAVAAARAATLDEPQGWINWKVLGEAYAGLGNQAAALVAYQRARSLNPKFYK